MKYVAGSSTGGSAIARLFLSSRQSRCRILLWPIFLVAPSVAMVAPRPRRQMPLRLYIFHHGLRAIPSITALQVGVTRRVAIRASGLADSSIKCFFFVFFLPPSPRTSVISGYPPFLLNPAIMHLLLAFPFCDTQKRPSPNHGLRVNLLLCILIHPNCQKRFLFLNLQPAVLVLTCILIHTQGIPSTGTHQGATHICCIICI